MIRDAINDQTDTLTTTITDSKDEIMKQNKEHNANQTAQLAESDRQRKREAEEIQAKLASIEQKQREEQARQERESKERKEQLDQILNSIQKNNENNYQRALTEEDLNGVASNIFAGDVVSVESGVTTHTSAPSIHRRGVSSSRRSGIQCPTPSRRRELSHPNQHDDSDSLAPSKDYMSIAPVETGLLPSTAEASAMHRQNQRQGQRNRKQKKVDEPLSDRSYPITRPTRRSTRNNSK